jgi:hypothetical protein
MLWPHGCGIGAIRRPGRSEVSARGLSCRETHRKKPLSKPTKPENGVKNKNQIEEKNLPYVNILIKILPSPPIDI